MSLKEITHLPRSLAKKSMALAMSCGRMRAPFTGLVLDTNRFRSAVGKANAGKAARRSAWQSLQLQAVLGKHAWQPLGI